jgi:SAM-dependent methyltransferase
LRLLRKILRPSRMKLRKRRLARFLSLIVEVPSPINILDVGGTQQFWETMEFVGHGDFDITLLNPQRVKVRHPRFTYVAGDGRNMDRFADDEFDVVFSNSVIEHVGDFDDQLRMAEEVRRVGKRYFLQTPNRYFPIEPHFFFPLFQFLPLSVRVFLLRNLPLTYRGRVRDRRRAFETASGIRLLNKSELRQLFPGGTLAEEKIMGLTKSFILYDGFESVD